MVIYRKGSRGEGVKQIQKALHLYPDGIFGILTEEAVREFQENNIYFCFTDYIKASDCVDWNKLW